MLAGIDYVGIGTLITAVGATVTSLIIAVRQTGTRQTANEIHAAVTTSNGTTLAGVVEKIDRATEAITETPETKP